MKFSLKYIKHPTQQSMQIELLQKPIKLQLWLYTWLTESHTSRWHTSNFSRSSASWCRRSAATNARLPESFKSCFVSHELFPDCSELARIYLLVYSVSPVTFGTFISKVFYEFDKLFRNWVLWTFYQFVEFIERFCLGIIWISRTPSICGIIFHSDYLLFVEVFRIL